MQRFSKPLGNIPSFKHRLVEQNEVALQRSLRLAALYRQQPERTHCKMCGHPLSGETAFRRYQVAYTFCPSCDHLNGKHQDSQAYADQVYLKEDYGFGYRALSSDEFERRVRSVYLPKAEFLKDLLLQNGEQPDEMHIADFGAGSGYFVAALSNSGMTATGFEISSAQVELAQCMLRENFQRAGMQTVAADRIIELAETQEAPVVSMIGVLEHLVDPIRFLEALRANRKTRYLYISIPMFSLAVYLETAFPNYAPRVLEGVHTHLFTQQSIEAMERVFGLQRLGEWWFGLDAFDLLRAITLSLSTGDDKDNGNGNAGLVARLKNDMQPLIDSLQEAVDRNKLCSEVHLLYALPPR